MEIIIHIEKKKLDIDYEQAMAEYTKRLLPFCRLKLITYKDFSKLSTQPDSVVFMIVPGKDTLSSEGLAARLNKLSLSGHSRLEFIISSQTESIAYGDSADTLSLSGFTMSCDLTAVVLSEQLYRAYTILNHITYHK